MKIVVIVHRGFVEHVLTDVCGEPIPVEIIDLDFEGSVTEVQEEKEKAKQAKKTLRELYSN